MWFFSSSLSQFNKRYPNLFGIEDEEMDEEGKDEGGEGENSGDSGEDAENSFQSKWGWLASVDSVSETIREPWGVVFKMNIVEFLNILSYIKDKANEHKRQMQKYKNSIK